jgi:hypothetical protein
MSPTAIGMEISPRARHPPQTMRNIDQGLKVTFTYTRKNVKGILHLH